MVICDSSFFESIEFIWEVSFSRVSRASWIQSSRLERRIRASNDDVGCMD